MYTPVTWTEPPMVIQSGKGRQNNGSRGRNVRARTRKDKTPLGVAIDETINGKGLEFGLLPPFFLCMSPTVAAGDLR